MRTRIWHSDWKPRWLIRCVSAALLSFMDKQEGFFGRRSSYVQFHCSSWVKGWARGVYHGLRRKHLQAYLDEFVFRFNRRKTRHAAFRSLFGLALNANPLTYKMLSKPEPCA